jgi:hypothetical protein
VASDEMVANFFAVDFQTLDELERALLSEVAQAGSPTPAELASALRRGAESLEPALYGLQMMGYLAGGGAQPYRIGNWFFGRWLGRVLQATAASSAPGALGA